MTTAATIYNSALEFIGESSNILSAEAEDQNEAYKRFLRLFEILPGKGIYIPMLRPATAATDVQEPEDTTEALICILAKMLRPYLRASTWGDSQREEYKSQFNYIYAQYGRPIKVGYDSTLPRGMGNFGDNSCWYYPGQDRSKVTYYDQRQKDESKFYTVDFTSEAGLRGTSVSSVEWESIGSTSATVSNESLSSNIATARLTFGNAGTVTVRARATMANSEVYDGLIEVCVSDPQSYFRDADNG